MRKSILLNILYIVPVTFFSLSTVATYAANQHVIDSLKEKLNTHQQQDTMRVILLLNISEAYFNVSTDSLSAYARKAYALSQKLDYKKGIYNSYTQIGNGFLAKNHFDSAYIYYTRSLEMSKKLDDKPLIAARYNSIGNVYLRKADYKTALLYYDTAIMYGKESAALSELARAHNNIASIYYEQGSYNGALQYYLEGLKAHQQLDNITDVETTTLNLANVYFRLDDYDKAKEYAQRALAMSKESGSKWSVISVLTTYAMIFDKEQLYDSALQYQYRALDVAAELNNAYLNNLLKSNIAEQHLKKGNLDSAAILYKESIEVSKQIQDDEGVAVAHKGYGQVLIKKGNRAEGIRYMESALDFFTENHMYEEAMEITGYLSGAYAKSGNYQQAYKYSTLKNTYQDTLAKQEVISSARRMEYEHELDKKEGRIALLEKDKELTQAKSRDKTIIIILFIIGKLLMATIIYLIYRNLKQTRRRSEVIEEQKLEIERQAEELQQLNSFKDMTFSVLSHDLRSPINSLTMTMSLLDEGIMEPEEFSLYKQEINNKLQSVSLMLDNLLLWARSQMKGENTLDIQKINVKRKALRAIATMKDAASEKNIMLEEHIDDELFIEADRNQVEMVVRNLVSNAIKFTPDGGRVTLSATKEGDVVRMAVTDTGVGMPQDIADKLFDGNPNISYAGTKGEKGTGIGLHLSHTFILNNKGTISVSSKEGDGTTFTITLPAA